MTFDYSYYVFPKHQKNKEKIRAKVLISDKNEDIICKKLVLKKLDEKVNKRQKGLKK